ncbi:la-related protein 1B isoform X2 [Amborella trichopoda]|uniref:la-related protein 1B isoform X2 n=1 Tax=Amborella trichopoda TaxID=13333 RepID=UPI0005D41A9E|nr:la-related protein 1B isoform X2 [Amborella trichopoda]|eukprot:XP_011622450.1 la-related protein 1B isoform X2 [Amborella trichopoda]
MAATMGSASAEPTGMGDQHFRRGRGLANAWSHVVRGTVPNSGDHESEVVDELRPVADNSSPVKGEPSSPNVASESSEASKKPAWNKPQSNEGEVGPVMGAVSWPALSDAAKAAKPSSDPLPKPLKEGDPPQKGHLLATPTHNSGSSVRPNNPPNHVSQNKVKSTVKRGGPPNGVVIPAITTQPIVVSDKPVASPKHNAEHPISTGVPNEAGSRGFVPPPQGHNYTRQHYMRGNGSQVRGQGFHGNNYMNRRNSRDHGRFNHQWNSQRNFNGRDFQTTQNFGPRNFSRPQPPQPPPPPYLNLPAHFGGHISFAGDMHNQVFFAVPPPVDPMRGTSFVYPSVPPTIYNPAQDAYLRSQLIAQIDHYFSSENLCKDVFLRGNMDEEGWVPLSLIMTFNRVRKLTNNMHLIIDALQTSSVVEVQGDKVRRRVDWRNWLLPPQGGIYPITSQSRNSSNEDLLTSSIYSLELDESSKAKSPVSDSLSLQVMDQAALPKVSNDYDQATLSLEVAIGSHQAAAPLEGLC